MRRCFSAGMPMPVSLTENSTTEGASLRIGCSGLQPTVATPTCRRTPPRSVNLNALESRFFNTCSRRLQSVVIALPKRSEEHTSELQSPDHLVCRLLLEKKNADDEEIS